MNVRILAIERSSLALSHMIARREFTGPEIH